MNINLHIERLVLDGINIPPGQRHLLQASMETELTRLLTNGGLAPGLVQSNVLPRLSTSGIQLTGNNPLQLGRQIAQSVYGGIGHE
jgi:di/tricarboxylate transporter